MSAPEKTAAARRAPLGVGESAPLLHFKSFENERFAFGSMGGRYLLVGWFGHMGGDLARGMAAKLAKALPLQQTDHRVFVAVSSDARDLNEPMLRSMAKHIVVLFDHDQAAMAAWGLTRPAPDGKGMQAAACWYLLDPGLRVMRAWPLNKLDEALEVFARLPAPDQHAGVPLFAPALLVPRVFEPEFCRHLIGVYESGNVRPSGVTREIGGRTEVVDAGQFKRRTDVLLEDEALQAQIRARLVARLIPEIHKAFQFQATRIERYIVSCYEAERPDGSGGGFFKPHRDNTTRGTLHRRFAVTINLNAEEYEGGDLRFPEYGNALHRAPSGGAVVFSCSLLHEAMPVTRGKRYAFLPFLYDDAAAAIRDANKAFLGESLRDKDDAAKPAGATGSQA